MPQRLIPVLPAEDDRYCDRHCPWVPSSTGGRCKLFHSVLGGGPVGQLERAVYCREATAKVAPKANLKDMKIGGITLR